MQFNYPLLKISIDKEKLKIANHYSISVGRKRGREEERKESNFKLTNEILWK